jgi:hypothetical protein
MQICKIGLCALFLGIFLSGCATTKGTTPKDKRHAILDMKKDTLTELYRVKPQARSQMHGVVKNNKTGKHTYMKMGEVGIGLGLGLKDFRAIFIFHDHNTMNKFIESGWEFGGHADAAAKASDKGGAVGGEILLDNITIYQLTESGLALQATIKGTKYWKDDALNYSN